MKFQYSEKKVKLPGNVHAYAEKKVMKLARYFEEDAEALVVFSVEKNRNKVELTVHGAGTWFRASESTSDMFASIDAAVSTIEGQIRKNKTRLARRLRQDAFVRSVQEETSFVPEVAEDDLSYAPMFASSKCIAHLSDVVYYTRQYPFCQAKIFIFCKKLFASKTGTLPTKLFCLFNYF